MLEKQYFGIILDDNLAEVEKIDEDKYNYFKDIFVCVYKAKNGDTYPLHQNFDACLAMLIVDEDHLNELLNDLIDQGFCETIEFNFIEDYFNGNYNQYVKAF